MTWQLFLGIATFVIVTTGTPGPNNVLLLNSGAQLGIRRSLPLLIGINNGVVLLVILMMLGLGEVFARYPLSQQVLKWLGGAYLLYLAYKIGSAKVQPIGAQSSAQDVKAMRWIEGVLFQFINPKVWMMAITAVSSFTVAGDDYYLCGAVIVLAFMTLGASCNLSWVALGVAIQKLLSTPARQRGFNLGMAVLTVATIAMIV
ncbi:MAG: LysE family translocator [Pseudomonadales bacterium]